VANLAADEDQSEHGFVSEGAHAQGQSMDRRSKACDWRDARQGGFPRASVRECPGEGVRASGRCGRGLDAEVAGRGACSAGGAGDAA
jgi:hypothetical protein